MGKKLYIGNLPFSATEETLTDRFSQCGTVESARIIMDRDSGRSKGFGFVEMSTDEDAQKAITMFDGKDFGGRNLVVNEAKPMTDRPRRDARPRGGSNYGGGGGNYRNSY